MATRTQYQGLATAARALRYALPSGLVRKFIDIDCAYNIVQHLDGAVCDEVTRDLDGALSACPRGGPADGYVEVAAPPVSAAAQLFDIFDCRGDVGCQTDDQIPPRAHVRLLKLDQLLALPSCEIVDIDGKEGWAPLEECDPRTGFEMDVSASPPSSPASSATAPCAPGVERLAPLLPLGRPCPASAGRCVAPDVVPSTWVSLYVDRLTLRACSIADGRSSRRSAAWEAAWLPVKNLIEESVWKLREELADMQQAMERRTRLLCTRPLMARTVTFAEQEGT